MGVAVGLAVCLVAPHALLAGEVLEVEAGPTGESGVYRMDARVILKTRPAALRWVILHLCEFKEDLPYVTYCRVFRNHKNQSWSYAVVDVPVLNPRDYVIVSTIVEDLKPDGSGVYRTRWDRTTAAGPAPRKGFVRLKVNEGSWTLRPAKGGRHTLLEYHVRTAPGGVVPSWASAFVAKRTLPDYVATLERLALAAESAGRVTAPDPADPWDGVLPLPLDKPLPAAGPRRPPPLMPPL